MVTITQSDDHPTRRTRRHMVLGVEVEDARTGQRYVQCLSHVKKIGTLLDFATRVRTDLKKPFITAWHDGYGHDSHCPIVIVDAQGRVHLCSHESHDVHNEKLDALIIEKDDRRRCRACGRHATPKRWGRGHQVVCVDSFSCEAHRAHLAATDPQWARIMSYRPVDTTETNNDGTPSSERPARTRTPKPGKEPKPCACECGGMTKGGRFLPGHDSKYHARLKREAEAK
jgi:hypothetical protein